MTYEQQREFRAMIDNIIAKCNDEGEVQEAIATMHNIMIAALIASYT